MITQPGKFEGCHEFAPYFWEQWLNGCYDESLIVSEREISVWNVTSEDTLKFPELIGYVRVLLWEDDNGFVHCIPTNEPLPEEDDNEPTDLA